jgi:hypothetical protein
MERTVMVSFLRSENFQVETWTGIKDAVKKISEAGK